jgi:hypothetical protein
MSDDIDIYAPIKLHLYKLNQRSGLWEHERSAENAASGYDWYEIFQRDDPKGLFYLGKTKPGYKQTVRALQDPEHWRRWYAPPRNRRTSHPRTR